MRYLWSHEYDLLLDELLEIVKLELISVLGCYELGSQDGLWLKAANPASELLEKVWIRLLRLEMMGSGGRKSRRYMSLFSGESSST